MILWILVPLGIIGIVIVWAILIYNSLVKKTAMVEEGWSGIDAQLKRRANLIPNLVETVKGYMDHEKGTLDAVIKARGESLGAKGVAAQGLAETHLGAALGKLFALAEAYPDRDLNVLVDSFPSNLVANSFSFRKAEFFEIEDASDRAVPEVDFS